MSIPDENVCPHCDFEVPDNHEICPHCYIQVQPPVNVRRARHKLEQDALKARYADAVGRTADRASVVQAFESAVSGSRAVMVTTLTKLLPQATQHIALYPAFHDLADLRFTNAPDLNEPAWGENRMIAETRLLGESAPRDKLHYAALSLNDAGLNSYAQDDLPVTVWLSERMVSHRTTVFETNSGLHVERGHSKFPLGWRATWEDRGKLGVAKLADRLTQNTQSAEFHEILLRPGPTSLDDDFIEVHVFGTMTIRTFENVIVTTTPPTTASGLRNRPNRNTTSPDVLRDYCDKHDVPFKIL
jgi:hypothetical protein